ncbi:hypothetical protein ccbrp13_66590 [Ktedonobacteria bacterium brp13]|nr:hypothetical protein ccbrp13_66590 [Ktedonobacteria bacterium brp13]
MSWKTINAILALAIVDERFCEELLRDPVRAIRLSDFKLTSEEQEKISHIIVTDLAEFSQKALDTFYREEDW